ncbi:iron-sulfur assembly protein, putative [Plasmodium ovale]|uniref:Iron-sulfur assembly protein, putative n=3 Tax=Plasmodium ovale TaxID=36330 RepID=A0A1D3RDB6_PLAOA|nr:iron-sulfur assembly protein, putative [Plasmodium ovale]
MLKFLNRKHMFKLNLLNIRSDFAKRHYFFSPVEGENETRDFNNDNEVGGNKKKGNVINPILHLSNEAINKMKEINVKYQNSKALKVSVEAGGCSGFQYFFSLINKKDIKEKDIIVYDKECVVIIDKQASEILRNCKIHYTNNLISKKFTIENIQNLSSKCSCGNSFDIIF